MKKLIGYAGAYTCYWLSNLFNRLSFLKYKGRFIGEKPRWEELCTWLDNKAMKLSIVSYDIQLWSKIDKPYNSLKLDDRAYRWKDRHEVDLSKEEQDWIDDYCLKDHIRRILENPEDFDLI